MSRWHTAQKLLTSSAPMRRRERPASGLATAEEAASAMENVLGEPADDYFLEDWRYVDELFRLMPDPITIWRAIGLREGEALDEGNLGLCWTWDEGAAEAYNRPSDADDIVIAHGEVAKGGVDWPATFALNIRLPEEKEIRLLPGAGVELLDVDGRKVGRRVTARSASAEWAYHATDADRLRPIAEEGLVPQEQPEEHADEARGEEGAVVFFCPEERFAAAWGGVVVRFPWPDESREDPYGDAMWSDKAGGVVYTSHSTPLRIPPERIEVKLDGRWVPLVSAMSGPGILTPRPRRSRAGPPPPRSAPGRPRR